MASHPTAATSATPAIVLACTPVRAAMQLGLYECDPEADLRTLARTMAERTIHAVVVPDVANARGLRGRLAWGIVSDIELMRALRPGMEQTSAGEIAGHGGGVRAARGYARARGPADGRPRHSPPRGRIARYRTARRHALHAGRCAVRGQRLSRPRPINRVVRAPARSARARRGCRGASSAGCGRGVTRSCGC